MVTSDAATQMFSVAGGNVLRASITSPHACDLDFLDANVVLLRERAYGRAHIQARGKTRLMKRGLLQKCSRDEGTEPLPLVWVVGVLGSLKCKAGV